MWTHHQQWWVVHHGSTISSDRSLHWQDHTNPRITNNSHLEQPQADHSNQDGRVQHLYNQHPPVWEQILANLCQGRAETGKSPHGILHHILSISWNDKVPKTSWSSLMSESLPCTCCSHNTDYTGIYAVEKMLGSTNNKSKGARITMLPWTQI